MDWTVYLLIQKPLYQAFIFLLLTPILVLVLHPKSADTAWLIAVYAFVAFLIVNAGMLWFDPSPWRYFFISLASAVGYILLIAIIMPGVLKILRLQSPQESAMAFLIVIYQPIALLLVMLVRWIATKT